jgi:WD40 repeat protein
MPVTPIRVRDAPPSVAPPTLAARREATLVIQSTHAAEVSSVAWSPDGRLVATSDGYDVRLWNPETGELRGVLAVALLSPGVALAFGPDGTTLAVAAYKRIVVWDLATGSIRFTVATDGHSALPSNNDGPIWDGDAIRRRTNTPIGAQAAFATASRDASRVLAVREDGLAVVWDLSGRKVLATLQDTPLPKHSGPLIEPDKLDFSEDGSRVQGIFVAPGSHGWEFEYTVRVWSARTGRLESTRTIAGSGVYVRPSRDGSKRAFLSSPYYLDPGYRLFLSGVPDALVVALARDPRLVFDVAWESDGSRLSITRARTRPANRDDVVHERWDVASGRRLSNDADVDAGQRLEGGFDVDGAPPQPLRITRKADGAWLDVTPLFGPSGPELVTESSTGAIDVVPPSSSLVRFRVGPDMRTSPMVDLGEGMELRRSISRDPATTSHPPEFR